jgi:hypothetical protein
MRRRRPRYSVPVANLVWMGIACVLLVAASGAAFAVGTPSAIVLAALGVAVLVGRWIYVPRSPR